MPSGSVTLLEAAKAGSDTLKRGVVETIVRESPILERLPMMTIQGNALKHMEEGTLPTPEFRQVNATYSRSWGSDKEHFWGTTILGGEVFVDNYLVRVRGNVRDVKATQYMKMAKAMAMTFDKTFFDGTGTANDFKGVNALIDEGFGFKYDDGQTNGAALTLDRMDEAHDLLRGGMADQILMPRRVRTIITQKARSFASGVSLIDVGTDSFGRKVNMWNDIPFGIVGDDRDGNLILNFDETQGSNSDAASIYFIKYGTEENVCGLMGLGGSFDVQDFGETEAAPGHLGRVEVYPGIAIFNQYSIVRYAGIRDV